LNFEEPIIDLNTFNTFNLHSEQKNQLHDDMKVEFSMIEIENHDSFNHSLINIFNNSNGIQLIKNGISQDENKKQLNSDTDFLQTLGRLKNSNHHRNGSSGTLELTILNNCNGSEHKEANLKNQTYLKGLIDYNVVKHDKNFRHLNFVNQKNEIETQSRKYNKPVNFGSVNKMQNDKSKGKSNKKDSTSSTNQFSSDNYFRRKHLESEKKILKIKQELQEKEISEMQDRPLINMNSKEIVNQLKLRNPSLNTKEIPNSNNVSKKQSTQVTPVKQTSQQNKISYSANKSSQGNHGSSPNSNSKIKTKQLSNRASSFNKIPSTAKKVTGNLKMHEEKDKQIQQFYQEIVRIKNNLKASKCNNLDNIPNVKTKQLTNSVVNEHNEKPSIHEAKLFSKRISIDIDGFTKNIPVVTLNITDDPHYKTKNGTHCNIKRKSAEIVISPSLLNINENTIKLKPKNTPNNAKKEHQKINLKTTNSYAEINLKRSHSSLHALDLKGPKYRRLSSQLNYKNKKTDTISYNDDTKAKSKEKILSKSISDLEVLLMKKMPKNKPNIKSNLSNNTNNIDNKISSFHQVLTNENLISKKQLTNDSYSETLENSSLNRKSKIPVIMVEIDLRKSCSKEEDEFNSIK